MAQATKYAYHVRTFQGTGLYPNLSEQAYGLLEKETVLSSIVKG